MSGKNHKRYRSRHADDLQASVHNNFSSDSKFSDPDYIDRIILWTTLFRRNIHRFVIDYLGIKLHWYQIIVLWAMSKCNRLVIIAARASAKSFLISLYAVSRAILYPRSEIVLASATRGQSKLLVSRKILGELCAMSPTLEAEIEGYQNNQTETIINFKNKSSIIVVTANDNARGHRSHVLVREEFRQIKKDVEDRVLSPFQYVRIPPYRLLPEYANMPELVEEAVDIYISSSWFDDGNWMWDIVDSAYEAMLDGKPEWMFAFDESVILAHGFKTQAQLRREKAKQDPMTWKIEFENCRLKENTHAFFTHTMMSENQTLKMPFYPRLLVDYKMGKKNPYFIKKQVNEVRVVACDMAFISRVGNDRSAFSCIRMLPETTSYPGQLDDEITIDNGYRKQVCYIESMPGNDTMAQAIRIRQLFEDFDADYIVLDLRNGGIGVYDALAKVMYDIDRGKEYSPLSCMNDDELAKRIVVEGATPCIYVVSASQALNSAIALDFANNLNRHTIDFLVGYNEAIEDVLPNIPEYVETPDASVQAFFESPFFETQALISETINLVYEKKEQTGAIVVHEQGKNLKDRYTSVSYGSYFGTILGKDLIENGSDYECVTLVN